MASEIPPSRGRADAGVAGSLAPPAAAQSSRSISSSIKAALGKLAADPSELLAEVEPAGFQLLPVGGDHAAAVSLLPALHKDPFDRMLIAQAKTAPLLLLTNDAALPAYGDCVKLVGTQPPR